jgi:hypothetical protein
VRINQRSGDVTEDADNFTDLEGSLGNPLAQGVALYVRRREPGQPVDVSGGEHGNDVRVLELCGEEDFAAEPLDGDAREELRREHLDDDAAIEGLSRAR